MTRRTRRWLLAALTAATTSALMWLPAAAHAGITLNALD
jgi:hypothetical protein